MQAAQIYYEFSREVDRMRTNILTTNDSVYKDTQILTKQLLQMRVIIEERNREFDRQLNDLKKLIMILSKNSVQSA